MGGTHSIHIGCISDNTLVKIFGVKSVKKHNNTLGVRKITKKERDDLYGEKKIKYSYDLFFCDIRLNLLPDNDYFRISFSLAEHHQQDVFGSKKYEYKYVKMSDQRIKIINFLDSNNDDVISELVNSYYNEDNNEEEHNEDDLQERINDYYDDLENKEENTEENTEENPITQTSIIILEETKTRIEKPINNLYGKEWLIITWNKYIQENCELYDEKFFAIITTKGIKEKINWSWICEELNKN